LFPHFFGSIEATVIEGVAGVEASMSEGSEGDFEGFSEGAEGFLKELKVFL
jgi:hypothetical protein